MFGRDVQRAHFFDCAHDPSSSARPCITHYGRPQSLSKASKLKSAASRRRAARRHRKRRKKRKPQKTIIRCASRSERGWADWLMADVCKGVNSRNERKNAPARPRPGLVLAVSICERDGSARGGAGAGTAPS
eukprot:scaffold7453_cov128-Isochrysis_galbana.AAC.9